MGVTGKRIGLIVAGFVVGVVVAIPFQMLLPFPSGLYAGLVSIIVFTVIFAVYAFNKNKNSDKSPKSILEERYAKGEITKEEFDKMKEDLS